jgi:predicted dienelactone hydrolase
MKTQSFIFGLVARITFMVFACISPASANENGDNDGPSKSAGESGSMEREYSPASVELQWFDIGRARQAPVKIYYPAAGNGPFPVVLFSHGLGRSREDCAYLGIHWASRGYVTVFVEHAGSDEGVWRGKVQPKKHLKEAYENPTTLRNRPLDLRFALDRMEQLKREGDPLAARFDLDRVGAAGCDLGAETVLGLAGQVLPGGIIISDRRIRAVIAMSPPVPLGRVPMDIAYKDIKTPCLYMTGSKDDGIVGETKAYQRRIPFDNVSGADQYLATFFGGDHMIFAGRLRQRNSEKDLHFQPLICEASTIFWDAYLQEKPQAVAAIRAAGLNALLGNEAWVEKKFGADTVRNAAESANNPVK